MSDGDNTGVDFQENTPVEDMTQELEFEKSSDNSALNLDKAIETHDSTLSLEKSIETHDKTQGSVLENIDIGAGLSGSHGSQIEQADTPQINVDANATNFNKKPSINPFSTPISQPKSTETPKEPESAATTSGNMPDAPKQSAGQDGKIDLSKAAEATAIEGVAAAATAGKAAAKATGSVAGGIAGTLAGMASATTQNKSEEKTQTKQSDQPKDIFEPSVSKDTASKVADGVKSALTGDELSGKEKAATKEGMKKDAKSSGIDVLGSIAAIKAEAATGKTTQTQAQEPKAREPLQKVSALKSEELKPTVGYDDAKTAKYFADEKAKLDKEIKEDQNTRRLDAHRDAEMAELRKELVEAQRRAFNVTMTVEAKFAGYDENGNAVVKAVTDASKLKSGEAVGLDISPEELAKMKPGDTVVYDNEVQNLDIEGGQVVTQVLDEDKLRAMGMNADLTEGNKTTKQNLVKNYGEEGAKAAENLIQTFSINSANDPDNITIIAEKDGSYKVLLHPEAKDTPNVCTNADYLSCTTNSISLDDTLLENKAAVLEMAKERGIVVVEAGSTELEARLSEKDPYGLNTIMEFDNMNQYSEELAKGQANDVDIIPAVAPIYTVGGLDASGQSSNIPASSSNIASFIEETNVADSSLATKNETSEEAQYAFGHINSQSEIGTPEAKFAAAMQVADQELVGQAALNLDNSNANIVIKKDDGKVESIVIGGQEVKDLSTVRLDGKTYDVAQDPKAFLDAIEALEKNAPNGNIKSEEQGLYDQSVKILKNLFADATPEDVKEAANQGTAFASAGMSGGQDVSRGDLGTFSPSAGGDMTREQEVGLATA